MNPMTNAALECLLWVETYTEDGVRLADADLSDYLLDYNIHPDIVSGIDRMLNEFLAMAGDLLADDWTDDQIGHDFILTANRHGAGFWDRGLPNGDELSEIAQTFGTISAYLDTETNTIMPWEGF